MTNISLPLVTYINGSVYISQNNALQSIDMTNVIGIGSSLQIDNNAVLTNLNTIMTGSSIPATPGASIGGNLFIISSPTLANIYGFTKLTSIASNYGAVRITGLPSLTSLSGLSNINGTVSFIELINLPLLTDITPLRQLSGSLDRLQIINTGITTLSLSWITMIGTSLNISYNPSLTTMTLGIVGDMGSVWISGNNILSSLASSFAGVTSVTGGLVVLTNPLLRNVSFPVMNAIINGPLDITANYLDQGISLPVLTQVGGLVRIQGNIQLTTLTGMNQVTRIMGSLLIAGNTNLTTMINLFTSLQRVDGPLIIRDSISLLTMYQCFQAPVMNITGGSLTLSNLPVILTMSQTFDGLRYVSPLPYTGLTSQSPYDISITSTNLSTITGFGSLERVSGSIVISSNAQLVTIQAFSKIISVPIAITISINTLLQSILAPTFQQLVTAGTITFVVSDTHTQFA
jgi:hypothetical protein